MVDLSTPQPSFTPENTPDEYEILVEGALNASWADWFDGISVVALENGNTTRLSGAFRDQAALHGLLARIRDLNLKLISVKKKN